MRRPETRQQLNDEFRVTLRLFAQQIELLLPVAARAGVSFRTRGACIPTSREGKVCALESGTSSDFETLERVGVAEQGERVDERDIEAFEYRALRQVARVLEQALSRVSTHVSPISAVLGLWDAPRGRARRLRVDSGPLGRRGRSRLFCRVAASKSVVADRRRPS